MFHLRELMPRCCPQTYSSRSSGARRDVTVLTHSIDGMTMSDSHAKTRIRRPLTYTTLRLNGLLTLTYSAILTEQIS